VEVAAKRRLLARRIVKQVPDSDPADRLLHGPRARHVLQREVVLQGRGVHLAAPAMCSSAFFSLRRRAALVEVAVQRLDAEPVTRPEQHPLLGVPDQEGEHAAQLADDVLAQVVVAGDDRLTVAVGLERRAELFVRRSRSSR